MDRLAKKNILHMSVDRLQIGKMPLEGLEGKTTADRTSKWTFPDGRLDARDG